MFGLIKLRRSRIVFCLDRRERRVIWLLGATGMVLTLVMLTWLLWRPGSQTVYVLNDNETIIGMDWPQAVESARPLSPLENKIVEPSDAVFALITPVFSEKGTAPPRSGRNTESLGDTESLTSRSGGSSDGWMWPVRGKITSPFGSRGGEMHTGLDLDGGNGSPVKAAHEGKVIFVGWRGNYGQQVVIDHGDGIVTTYSHLSGYKVKIGTQVSVGDTIGLVGSTGRSTGAHLHFEVIKEGKHQNPLDYLGTGR